MIWEKFGVAHAVPYAAAFYPVSKVILKWDPDLTHETIEKHLAAVNFFHELETFFKFMFDYIADCFKAELKQLYQERVRFFEYRTSMGAPNTSRFNSYNMLKHLPPTRRVVATIHNGKGLLLSKRHFWKVSIMRF